MTRDLCRRRWARWLALLAVAASTIAPSLSRLAIAATRSGGEWVEVCTPQGMRIVSTASVDGGADLGTPSGSRDGGLIAGDPCPFCGTGAAPLAPPPEAGICPRPVPTRRAAPPPPDAELARVRPFTAATPRGPPARS